MIGAVPQGRRTSGTTPPSSTTRIEAGDEGDAFVVEREHSAAERVLPSVMRATKPFFALLVTVAS